MVVRDRENEADLAVTLAHVPLHDGIDNEDKQSKRELEAEAVGYTVVGISGWASFVRGKKEDSTDED